MTTDSTFVTMGNTGHHIRDELLDGIIETVILAAGPAERAAIIANLIYEICAAVRWRPGRDTFGGRARSDELISILQLSEAADDHRRRMSTPVHIDDLTSLVEELRLTPVSA